MHTLKYAANNVMHNHGNMFYKIEMYFTKLKYIEKNCNVLYKIEINCKKIEMYCTKLKCIPQSLSNYTSIDKTLTINLSFCNVKKKKIQKVNGKNLLQTTFQCDWV